MIVSCDGCQTKYKLGDDKVPEAGIRVRCPKCRFVWRLTPPPAAVDTGIEITTSQFDTGVPLAETPVGGWNARGQASRGLAAGARGLRPAGRLPGQ